MVEAVSNKTDKNSGNKDVMLAVCRKGRLDNRYKVKTKEDSTTTSIIHLVTHTHTLSCFVSQSCRVASQCREKKAACGIRMYIVVTFFSSLLSKFPSGKDFTEQAKGLWEAVHMSSEVLLYLRYNMFAAAWLSDTLRARL